MVRACGVSDDDSAGTKFEVPPGLTKIEVPPPPTPPSPEQLGVLPDP